MVAASYIRVPQILYVAVFLWENVYLFLLMTILLEYLHLCNAKWLIYSSQTIISPKFHLFSRMYTLPMTSYFFQTFAGKIGAALQTLTTLATELSPTRL